MQLARTGIFTSVFARYFPSANQFFGSSECGVYPQCLIDCQERGFHNCTFAGHVLDHLCNAGWESHGRVNHLLKDYL